jgi:Uma2 family endonuclease
MTSPAPRRPLTVEEYLRFEESSPVRHEYVAGAVYAMAPVRARHHRIVSNIYGRVWTALRGRACEAFRESFMLRAGDALYYPDVMVVCAPIGEDETIADDACLIVEVTSPSTAGTDRREKLANYKKLPSLRAYLIVDQRRRRVERHIRDEAGEWWQSTVTGDEPIPLPCVDLAITLAEIYEGVRAPAVSEPPPGYGAGEWYTDEEYAEEEA